MSEKISQGNYKFLIPVVRFSTDSGSPNFVVISYYIENASTESLPMRILS